MVYNARSLDHGSYAIEIGAQTRLYSTLPLYFEGAGEKVSG